MVTETKDAHNTSWTHDGKDDWLSLLSSFMIIYDSNTALKTFNKTCLQFNHYEREKTCLQVAGKFNISNI